MKKSASSWKREKTRQKRRRAILITVALAAFCLPIAWTLLASFGIRPDASSYPPKWTFPPFLDEYKEVGIAEKGFWNEILASTTTSVVSTAATTLACFLAAYALVHSRLRRKTRVAQGFLVLASLPVMAYVIPLNDTIKAMSLYDTFAGVSLAQAAIFAPLGLYVLFGYLSQVSFDFEEAARLEGASPVRTLLRVILPMNAPGVAATAIVIFVLNWNSFLAPMIVSTSHVRTIPMAMSDFFMVDRELEWPTAAAALIASVLPVVAVVAVTHRMLERFFLGSPREAS
jgi:ABC-type glycerol-3-phosphate transport system permease component